MKSLTVVPVGARVEFAAADGAHGPEARVVTVRIQEGGCVDYEVAYWNGGTRCTAWVGRDEFKPCRAEGQRIGFLKEKGA